MTRLQLVNAVNEMRNMPLTKTLKGPRSVNSYRNNQQQRRVVNKRGRVVGLNPEPTASAPVLEVLCIS